MGWWLKIRLYFTFQTPPSKWLCFQNLASVVKGRTGWKISWLGARKTLSQQINGESTKLAGSFTRDEEQERNQILETVQRIFIEMVLIWFGLYCNSKATFIWIWILFPSFEYRVLVKHWITKVNNHKSRKLQRTTLSLSPSKTWLWDGQWQL